MQENVTINDLLKLGDEESYEKEIHEIKKRIDATTVAIEKQQDIYYQKTSKVADDELGLVLLVSSGMKDKHISACVVIHFWCCKFLRG